MAFINLPTRRTALLFATDLHTAEVQRVLASNDDAIARHMNLVRPYWYVTGSLVGAVIPVESQIPRLALLRTCGLGTR